MTDPTMPPPPGDQQQSGQQAPYMSYRQQFAPPARRRRPWLVALIVAGGAVVLVIGLVVALGLALGDTTKTAASSTTTAAASPTTDSTPVNITTTPGPDATTEPPPAEDQTLTFGETGTWEDGMSVVAVSAVKASFSATSTNPGPGIKVTVKVTNGTSDAVDLFPDANLRLGDEGATTEMVYGDGCDGLSDLGRLAPKRSVTARLCFTGRSKQVDLSFAPDSGHEAQTWTGTVR